MLMLINIFEQMKKIIILTTFFLKFLLLIKPIKNMKDFLNKAKDILNWVITIATALVVMIDKLM